MIEVTNGIKTHIIPKGAMKIFKPLGFYEVGHEPVTPVFVAETEEQTDEQFVEAVEEIPMAQWSKEQVKRYAGIYGIDISKTKNVEEALDMIREFRNEAEEEAE